ncbi:type IV secretory system conjugative DNA transfer family protein [Nocardia farcinica]|uniref:type IV secretory system conjugative DNA transfer family protein n=1 Tax=Nocardia farcinica TaxID=37329 RepID=UPI001895522B|nr:type IV secretory system conjugative DNA transfer family protein [Nocardia farcinica]MBF6185044.1 type IV secretory system conjugative DNA transfer family protein [Nocardia farcinica]MBF6363988.1 type IV secretory system conjugative DNA transfer family protein [Nocardia farcinica]
MTTNSQAPELTADSLVWQLLFWPSPFREGAATSLLRHWAAQKHAPQLILEARSTVDGVEYLVGSQLRHAQGVRRSVEQLVSGAVVTPFDTEERGEIVTARRLKLTATDWPLEPVDRVASSRSILSALTAVRGTERLVIQVILGPRRQPMLPPVTGADGGHQSMASKVWNGLLPDRRPNARQALVRKLGQHGFSAVIRIGVEAGTAERRKSLLLGLAAAIGTVETAGVHFKLANEKAGNVNEPKATWSILTPAQPVSVPELSHLLAWPVSDHDERFPGQPPLHPKPVRPTPPLLTGERVIARANAPGVSGTIGYDVLDSMRHTWVIGPNGTGKSTLLLNLIVQDLEAGRPVVVIEPKDLVADILARIPEHRKQDIVLLDPLDEAPVGINPLAHSDGRTPEVIADSLFGTIHAIHGDLGPRSADILRNSLEVLAKRDDASLTMLPLLLTNPGFRRSLTQRVIRDDPFAAGPFWAWFDSLSPEAADTKIAPLSNKLRPLLTKQLRAVLAQRSPKFNVRQVLRENKVLLVPLQKGVIGPEAAQLLGAIVLAELWQAIRERAGTPENFRTPVMVYIDEVQDYLRLPTDLGDALATARSLRAGFHLAHQYQKQLPHAMLDAFRNNARSRITFQLQAGDAKDMATGQSVLAPEDFGALPAHHVYVNLMRDNTVQPWASGVTMPPPPETSDPNEIRRLSRERYGQPLDEIEAGFAELLDQVNGGADGAPRRRRRQA